MTEQLPEHWHMGPSSSYQWIPCPGSLDHCEGYEDEAGFAARRGTLGHSMVEARLNGTGITAEEFAFYHSDEFDDEARDVLRRHVDECFDFVDNLRKDGWTIETETKIQDELIGEHGGTVDIIAIKGGILWVIDFKFGMIPVTIEDNKQIQCYLNLARQGRGKFRMYLGTIIQPALGAPMTREFFLDELERTTADVIRASISRDRKAGGHCQYCPHATAKNPCSTLAVYTIEQCQDFPNLDQLAASIQDDKPTDEQIDKLCRMYKVGKLAEMMTQGVGALLKRYAMKGHDIKGHGLQVGTQNRTEWADGDSVTKLVPLAGLRQEQIWKEPKPITPKEAAAALEMKYSEFKDKYGELLTTKEVQVMGKLSGAEKNHFPEFAT